MEIIGEGIYYWRQLITRNSVTMTTKPFKEVEKRFETEYEKLRLLNGDDEFARSSIMEERISVLHQLFRYRSKIINTIRGEE